MKQISLIATLLTVAVLSTACSSAPEKKAAAPAPAAPAAKPVADAALVAKAVKMALDADAQLKAFDLKVKGANDKKNPSKVDVTIDGSVDTGEQMAQAGMIAEKVKGVQFVNNNIMPKN